jgi:hypothetical protein
VVCPTPDVPARGSAALYAIMLNLYTNLSEAARDCEKKHGIKIKLGGPALGMFYFIIGLREI